MALYDFYLPGGFATLLGLLAGMAARSIALHQKNS
jgi:hypothetical protein